VRRRVDITPILILAAAPPVAVLGYIIGRLIA